MFGSAFEAISARIANSKDRRRRRGNLRRNGFNRPAVITLERRQLLAIDYWTGISANSGGTDNWSNAGNWSLDAVPGTTDTADFTSSESHYGAATVDTTYTIGALVIDSTWAGTLTVNNALAVNGNLTLASGTLTGTSTLTASGSGSQWSDGTLSANVTNAGTLSIATAGANLNLYGTLTNTGTINVTGTNNIFARSTSATIDNQSGATFDFTSAGNMYNQGSGAGTFNNAGTLEMTRGLRNRHDRDPGERLGHHLSQLRNP